MVLKIFFVLTVLPLVELWLLYQFTSKFGFDSTLLMIFVTGALGTALSKQQGLKAWREIQEQSRQGQVPASALFDAVLIFVAGLLLITPGVLTDIFGVFLLIPFTRYFVKLWLIAEFKRRAVIQVNRFGSSVQWSATVSNVPPPKDQPIDVEFERRSDIAEEPQRRIEN